MWDYCEEIRKTNSGSQIHVEVNKEIPDAQPTFGRLYICLHECMKSLKVGCRPLISLNICFLKEYYDGQMLTVVAMDDNNAFFVIAFTVVDVDSRETWKCFLEHLRADLGDYEEH